MILRFFTPPVHPPSIRICNPNVLSIWIFNPYIAFQMLKRRNMLRLYKTCRIANSAGQRVTSLQDLPNCKFGRTTIYVFTRLAELQIRQDNELRLYLNTNSAGQRYAFGKNKNIIYFCIIFINHKVTPKTQMK